MSDRHAELLRQRALMQEHLAWLDREIAATANTSNETPGLAPAPLPQAPTLPAPATTATVPPPQPSTSAAPGSTVQVTPAPDADSILERYRPPPGSLQRDVRKGCMLYFAAAFLLFGLGVVALYYLIRSH